MPAYFETGLMVGETAWHKMGANIDADDDRRFSISDCIDLAGMNQRIEMGKCFYVYGANNEYCDEVPGRNTTLRVYADGMIKPLGIVGPTYKPIQPIEAFEWFQPWLDTKEVAIETAGTLKGGTIDWVMARILRDEMDIGGGDQVAKYLTITTSHDGTEATRVGFTPVRIVCWNTLQMAFRHRDSKLLRVRHTEGQHRSLSAIRETIDLVDNEFKATADQYRKLLTCKLSLKELRAYVKMVCDVDPDADEKELGPKVQKRIDRIVNLALHGKGQTGEMTVWAAYNGVTEYLSHKVTDDAEKRLTSSTYLEMGQRAIDLACQLAA